MKRKVYIGADSAGFLLKKEVIEHLENNGYVCVDLGCDSTESCHYPIFASKVSEAVQFDGNSFGILICGTGIGMSMCANKHKGIRAACVSDTFSARLTRVHNDANVLCFGERVVGYGLAMELVDAFIETEFEGGRHAERIALITAIENEDFDSLK